MILVPLMLLIWDENYIHAHCVGLEQADIKIKSVSEPGIVLMMIAVSVLIVSNNLVGIKPSHKVWNIKHQPTNDKQYAVVTDL